MIDPEVNAAISLSKERIECKTNSPYKRCYSVILTPLSLLMSTWFREFVFALDKRSNDFIDFETEGSLVKR